MRSFVLIGKVLGGGAVLVALIGIMGFFTDRPSNTVLLFTLVPSSGSGTGSGSRGVSQPQSRIAALNLQVLQERPRVLTGDLFTARTPAISYDGRRVLFAGKRSEADRWQIWEQRVDGAHPGQVTRGMHDAIEPCYLPGGRIVFSGALSDRRGQHALFTCRRDGSRVRRITFGYSDDRRPTVLSDGRILFRQIRSGDETGMFMTIHPDGTVLQRFYGEEQSASRVISYRSSATHTYDIHEFDAVHHQVGRLLFGDPNADAIDPILALPQTRPRALTSVIDESKKTGWLLCLNIYRSRLPGVASLKPGEIRGIRIIAVKDDRTEMVLNEAPVEWDGSFYAEVPADTPLHLRLVDRDTRVVASLNSEIWVRPNEQRGCIGCHEDPELAPENRVPMAVTKPLVSREPRLERHDATRE